jgi:hypothetical protein
MARKSQEAVEVSHRTLEVLLNEVAEQSRSYQQALEKLLREKPGTSAYDANLGKVWAEAEVLATKAQHAKMVIDEYTESRAD